MRLQSEEADPLRLKRDSTGLQLVPQRQGPATRAGVLAQPDDTVSVSLLRMVDETLVNVYRACPKAGLLTSIPVPAGS